MNSSLKKILVPIDFSGISTWTIVQAAKMASKQNARLVLFHVISPATIDYPKNIGNFKNNDLNIKRYIRLKLKKIKKNIENVYGIKVSSFVKAGSIVQSIYIFAKLRKVDLIFMGTHGTSGKQEYLIGSKAQKLIKISKIPVLTIRKGKGLLGLKNILVPIDDSLHSREKLNITIQIAKLYKSKIHILGFINTGREEKQLLIKLMSVERLLKSLTLDFTIKVFKKKNLAKFTLNYGVLNKCNMIIVNAGHESKIQSYLLNLMEQHLVNHSLIPILTVKPIRGNYSNTKLIGYGNPFLY